MSSTVSGMTSGSSGCENAREDDRRRAGAIAPRVAVHVRRWLRRQHFPCRLHIGLAWTLSPKP